MGPQDRKLWLEIGNDEDLTRDESSEKGPDTAEEEDETGYGHRMREKLERRLKERIATGEKGTGSI